MAEQVFDKLQQEIDVIRQQEKEVRGLQDKMTAAGCFDKEDIATVGQVAVFQNQKGDALTKQLEFKKNLYCDCLVKIEQSLKSRSQLLQTQAKTLQNFPEILEYFAKKQASLEDQITAVKKAILQ